VGGQFGAGRERYGGLPCGAQAEGLSESGCGLALRVLWLFPLVVERNDGGASRAGNGCFCPPDVRRGGVGSKDCTVEEWLAGSGPGIPVHILCVWKTRDTGHCRVNRIAFFF